MRQQLRAHKAPSPSVPSLPRCAAHAPAPAPAPAPTFYHSGGPRDEASGSPVVKRRARGQRADMPTAPPFPSLPFAHCPLRLRCLLPPRRLPVVPDPDGGSHVPPRHLSAGSAHREWAGSSCPSFCLLFPCCALQDCRSSASSPVAVPNQTTTVTTAVGCGCAWHCLCWKHSSVSDRSVKKITLLLMIQQSNSSYQHQTNSSLQ